MTQNLGQVLRKHQVKITGSCRLNLDAVRPGQSQTAATARFESAAESSCQPQVRIIENSPQGVVLEFICSCGSQTYIRCEYASTV